MEKKKIKVSIIVPVYNVEKYLEESLTTLVNQTLDSYEIIVVNDGTKDNSQEIIDKFVKKYPKKVRSFIKENGGLSDARNFGVGKAIGEYIGFVDSDDYVREDMFELLYNKAIAEESDVVVCNYSSFDDFTVKEHKIIKKLENFNNSIEEKPELLFECKSYAWNKLYKRIWYLDNDFSFPLNQWFEDSAVVYNMLYLANKISVVDECLYYYRSDRQDSITNTINQKIFDVFKSCKSIITFYKGHTENKEVIDVVERLCQIHIFTRIKALIKKGSTKLKLKFYRSTIKFFKKFTPNWAKNPYYLKVKKRGVYLKIRHIPILMYIYFLIPKKVKKLARKILKKKKKTKKSKSENYLNKARLRELQLIELDILKEIDRVCKENKITYYLGEGTLLGAIRHQGFIPWDDDLDIVMPRKDYEKFLSVAGDLLKDNYALLNEQKDSSYYLPFSKVVSLNNFGFVNKLDKFEEKYNGPYVDIFPLDYFYTTNTKKVNRKYKKIRKIRDMLLLKAQYIKPKSRKRKRYNIESKFFTNEQLYKKLKKELVCCDDSSKYLCNFASSYHPSKQIVLKEVYGKPKYVKFEDGKFPVPNNSDELITTIYGEYMKMPSIKNRKCKHGFYDKISVDTMAITKPLEAEEMEKEALEEVRKLQLYELDILKEVDRVCKENDIKYYLGEGTLLGAIRHQGFIPWDDDVDIVMPREDFNRFLNICDEKLKSNYKLQFYHNIDSYWVQSPKVRLLDKTEFTQSALLKYTNDVGPYIDIFPLDYAPNSLAELEKQEKYIKTYRRILFLKTGFSKPKNRQQKFMKMYSKFISVKKIHEKINKKATMYNNGNKKYICNFGSYYSIKKEVFPTLTYGKPKYVKFEDSEFPVPSNYEYVLTTIYGDYMTLPPKNKQVAKHSFK